MKDLRARIEALPRTWIGDQPKLEQAFVVLADVLACLDAATPALPAPSTRPGGMRPTDGPRHTWRFERDDKGFTVTPSEAQAVESSTAEPSRPLVHSTESDSESPEAAGADREEAEDLIHWAYSKLHRREFSDLDDALNLDRMKLRLMTQKTQRSSHTDESDKPQVETGTGAPLLSDEREQFEKWARDSLRFRNFNRTGGYYDLDGLEKRWQSWQARAVIAAHQQPK
jgi:hypothetical protein